MPWSGWIAATVLYASCGAVQLIAATLCRFYQCELVVTAALVCGALIVGHTLATLVSVQCAAGGC